MISFQVQLNSFVKKKANSSIEQRNCKSYEKREWILISKMEINYQISQRNSFISSSSFFKLKSFDQKIVSHNLFLKFKLLEGHIFPLKFINRSFLEFIDCFSIVFWLFLCLNGKTVTSSSFVLESDLLAIRFFFFCNSQKKCS